MSRKLFTMAVLCCLSLTACDRNRVVHDMPAIDGGGSVDDGDGGNGGGNGGGGGSGLQDLWSGTYTAGDLCQVAAVHLADDCGWNTLPGFANHCNDYSACEARCYAATSCDDLDAAPGSDARHALDTCLTSCFAEAPGLCWQAESYVNLCGYTVATDWNTNGYCDAEEQCISNCALASTCGELAQDNQGEDYGYWACHDRCKAMDLRAGGLAYDATYCAQYPSDPHCTLAPPLDVPENACLRYPDASFCADPAVFCSTHPNDPYCQSSDYACALHPDSEACGSCYCDEFLDIRCSNPQYSLCQSSYELCLLMFIGAGGGGGGNDDFCYENPDAFECSICYYYEDSLECDASNEDEWWYEYHD